MNLPFQNTIVTIKLIQLKILRPILGIEDVSINYADGQIVQENKIIENNIIVLILELL